MSFARCCRLTGALLFILELPVHVNEPNYRAVIATSWSGMLAVLLAMLMLSPLQYAMNGQYEP
jgi:uncharacterized MnhB-related membrane protein